MLPGCLSHRDETRSAPQRSLNECKSHRTAAASCRVQPSSMQLRSFQKAQVSEDVLLAAPRSTGSLAACGDTSAKLPGRRSWKACVHIGVSSVDRGAAYL